MAAGGPKSDPKLFYLHAQGQGLGFRVWGFGLGFGVLGLGLPESLITYEEFIPGSPRKAGFMD